MIQHSFCINLSNETIEKVVLHVCTHNIKTSIFCKKDFIESTNLRWRSHMQNLKQNIIDDYL